MRRLRGEAPVARPVDAGAGGRAGLCRCVLELREDGDPVGWGRVFGRRANTLTPESLRTGIYDAPVREWMKRLGLGVRAAAEPTVVTAVNCA